MSGYILPLVEETPISENESQFRIAPLERGFATTIGNSLRRTTQHLRGVAARTIHIEGVVQELTALECVKEDVTDIVANVESLVFASDGVQNECKALIRKSGTGPVTGADIKLPAGFKVVNADKVIATLDERDAFEMDIHIAIGHGHASAEDNAIDGEGSIGEIAIQSHFTPVKRFAFREEESSWDGLGEEALLLDIETNGAITPSDALTQAIDLLTANLDACKPSPRQEECERQNIDILNLSNRAHNRISKQGINTIGELLAYGESGLRELDGMGEKSIQEIKDKLFKLGGLTLAE